MWIRRILFGALTFGGGAVIAGAYVAFISLIGIFPTLAKHEEMLEKKANLARRVYLYEWLIMLGVMAGTFTSLYRFSLPFHAVGLAVFTLFGGIFVGCLAGALEEVLNTLPILSRRMHIRHGLHILLMAAAAGKVAGSLIYFYILGK